MKRNARLWKISLPSLILVILLASCAGTNTTRPTVDLASHSAATASAPARTPTSRPAASVDQLSVWIPDDLLTNNHATVMNLLQQQVSRYTAKNPDVQVEIRIKKTSGSGNMMDTFQTASLVAPSSLPDLILLSGDDMEVSALKGLLYPFNGVQELLKEDDWAPVMRDLSEVEESTFGLPVLADATVLVSKIGAPLDASIYHIDHPILCYLNDAQAIFQVGLYLSADGQLPENGAVSGLDEEALSSSLDVIDRAFASHAFSTETLKLSGADPMVERYQKGSNDQMIVWFSDLTDAIRQDTIAPVPGVGNTSSSVARGWFWSMANPSVSRRTASVELAEYLTDPVFLSDLAAATGRMPVRQSARMEQNQKLEAQFSILQKAHPVPDGLLLVTIGPVLQDATAELLLENISPKDLAHRIVTEGK